MRGEKCFRLFLAKCWIAALLIRCGFLWKGHFVLNPVKQLFGDGDYSTLKWWPGLKGCFTCVTQWRFTNTVTIEQTHRHHCGQVSFFTSALHSTWRDPFRRARNLWSSLDNRAHCPRIQWTEIICSCTPQKVCRTYSILKCLLSFTLIPVCKIPEVTDDRMSDTIWFFELDFVCVWVSLLRFTETLALKLTLKPIKSNSFE